MDLVGRKLSLKKGALFMGWMKEVNEFIEKHKDHPVFGAAMGQLEQAKNTLISVSLHFAKAAAGGDPLYPMLHACPYLELFGETELAYLLLDQGIIAQEELQTLLQKAGAATEEAKAKVIEEQADAAFYSGKIHTAEFFVTNILPRVQATAAAILSGNRSALAIPDVAF
jgi:hypothetical protein